ncbi:MAG: cobyrinate a,c-diamide synthase [Pseudomonadota bacterium]
MGSSIPRLVIAGLSGDSGKTIASLCLLAAARRKGLRISAFKKGPDYIDAAWLSRLSGTPCRNLDTWMVEPKIVAARFAGAAAGSDAAVIEGNRGLFDGRDVEGTHSTAALSRLLAAPVVIVVNAVKTTRTLAALIKGCVDFDPDVRIAGVILNRVGGKRHERIVRDSIGKYCGLPVLGALPKLDGKSILIPNRHLGLVTPAELDHGPELEKGLADAGDEYLDCDGLLAAARAAGPLDADETGTPEKIPATVSIGYFADSVFTFYYPENLEALEAAGARLVPVSSLEDPGLPDIDAMYIGGGFPETHAAGLAQNTSMMQSVKKAAGGGMPVYAECGGLIYLCASLAWKHDTYPMAGVFPMELAMHEKPVGHGYTQVRVDRPNPFFEVGTVIKGHEFHYSGPVENAAEDAGCMTVETGVGLGRKRDGLLYKAVLSCYTHIHSDGVKTWASSMVSRAAQYKRSRGKTKCRTS